MALQRTMLKNTFRGQAAGAAADFHLRRK